jgi:Family of unknown function (DUF6515)
MLTMRRHIRAMSALTLAAALLLVAALFTSARAQEHGGHGGPPPAPHAQHYDVRYSHNHYYSAHGMVVTTVPGRPLIVTHAGAPYYYSGGVWYVPRGPSFVVVGAPVGVFVPVLPPFYTTVWFAGAPYYYANDTYYMYRADQGYEVVDPPGDPAGAIQGPQGPSYPGGPPPSANGPPPEGEDLFVYPQSGQSPDQEANDKYECHLWASTQTGFDPTQAGGGVPPDQTVAKGTDYKRAMRACLEGRGYSVR